MVCTFGDLTDVTWWRELRLDTRAIVGRDGRIVAEPPPGLDRRGRRGRLRARWPAPRCTPPGSGWSSCSARRATCTASPGPITHAVKFYEKGTKPLEIVTSRQWYIRNGGRDDDLRAALSARGRELEWIPSYMGVRYQNWVEGLNGDWLISRQRYFGVPFPVWYRIGDDGEVDYDDPIPADEAALPVDPSSDPPPGLRRGPAGPARRLHRRPRRHGHLGDVVAHAAARHRLGDRPRPVRAHVPDGPAAAGPRHHPHLAVLVGRPRPPRARLGPVAAGRHLRLGPRPRPQEDVEVEGQRRHAHPAARGVRHRRGPLLGLQRRAGHRHRRPTSAR